MDKKSTLDAAGVVTNLLAKVYSAVIPDNYMIKVRLNNKNPRDVALYQLLATAKGQWSISEVVRQLLFQWIMAGCPAPEALVMGGAHGSVVAVPLDNAFLDDPAFAEFTQNDMTDY